MLSSVVFSLNWINFKGHFLFLYLNDDNFLVKNFQPRSSGNTAIYNSVNATVTYFSNIEKYAPVVPLQAVVGILEQYMTRNSC